MDHLTIKINGIELEVGYKFITGTPNSEWTGDGATPGIPDSVEIQEVYLQDEDITSLINKESFSSIEEEVLKMH